MNGSIKDEKTGAFDITGLQEHFEQNADKLLVSFIRHDTGEIVTLPVIETTEGRYGVDVSALRKEFGLKAHAPGLLSLSATESQITYIDGEKGILRHGGYSIEELTENGTFLETVHLLHNGELPTSLELQNIQQEMAQNGEIPDHVKAVTSAFPKDAEPMNLLSTAVSALSATTPDQSNSQNIIAKMPTLVAMIHRHRQGQAFINPDSSLSYTENFLRMCFADEKGHYEQNPVLTQAMEKILILHADHEQNASTSVARGVRSTRALPFTAIAAGIGALSGPLHGGANTAVLKMLDEIGDVKNIPTFIDRAKNPDDEYRLMGFGHRVYKNFDPRASVLKGSVDDLLESLDMKDPRLVVAKELEHIATEDSYFVDRKLFPNVDFYSGIALQAMGFEPETFTTLFALGRTPGWHAHTKELIRNAEPIARPFQLYVGPGQRPYTPIEQRLG